MPSELTADVFWTRYFFRVHQIESEETRRKTLLQGMCSFIRPFTIRTPMISLGSVQNEEDFSWEDDEDEATSPKATALSPKPSPGEALTPVQTFQQSTVASTDPEKLSSPSSAPHTPTFASPRESSEDSYDLVSSGNVSTSGDGRLADKKPVADDPDSDWEWMQLFVSGNSLIVANLLAHNCDQVGMPVPSTGHVTTVTILPGVYESWLQYFKSALLSRPSLWSLEPTLMSCFRNSNLYQILDLIFWTSYICAGYFVEHYSDAHDMMFFARYWTILVVRYLRVFTRHSSFPTCQNALIYIPTNMVHYTGRLVPEVRWWYSFVQHT